MQFYFKRYAFFIVTHVWPVHSFGFKANDSPCTASHQRYHMQFSRFVPRIFICFIAISSFYLSSALTISVRHVFVAFIFNAFVFKIWTQQKKYISWSRCPLQLRTRTILLFIFASLNAVKRRNTANAVNRSAWRLISCLTFNFISKTQKILTTNRMQRKWCTKLDTEWGFTARNKFIINAFNA